jgi:hypothetical protein
MTISAVRSCPVRRWLPWRSFCIHSSWGIAFGLWTALVRGQALEDSGLPLALPGSQLRRVKVLAAQQGTHGAGLRQAAQFVCGGEGAALGVGGHLRVPPLCGWDRGSFPFFCRTRRPFEFRRPRMEEPDPDFPVTAALDPLNPALGDVRVAEATRFGWANGWAAFVFVVC